MRIQSHVYRKFYEVLWDEFCDREQLHDKHLKRYSQVLWHKKANGKFIVTSKILGKWGLSEQYFWKKVYELDPEKTTEGEIKSAALCAGLEYLGFKLTEEERKKPFELQAELLLKQFIAVHLSDTIGIPAEEDRSRKEGEEKRYWHVSYPGNEATQASLERTKRLVTYFYQCIGSGNYKEAWELLSKDFQNKLPWEGDFNRFAEGYMNKTGMKDMHVFDAVERFPAVTECLVLYEDELFAYHSSELSSLASMTVAGLEEFIKAIKLLEAKVKEAGGVNFQSLELYKLFEQGASEYIWYKCKIKPEDIAIAFPTRRTITVKRLYQCRCKLRDGEWRIDGIRGWLTQSAR